jgi:hypothetical protein
LPEHLKPSTDLASSPRMLCTHLEHRRLHLRGGSLGRMPRPTRAIAQTLRPRLDVAPEPLVPGLAADPEASAQLSYIRFRLPRQHHKLVSQRHGRYLLPGHDGTGHSALHIMPTSWPREGWVVAKRGQAGRREVSDMR